MSKDVKKGTENFKRVIKAELERIAGMDFLMLQKINNPKASKDG